MNLSKPRVLILVENLSVPRDGRVWQEALALTEAGYEVVVVCPRGRRRDTAPVELRAGVEIHRYPAAMAHAGVMSYAREYAWALWHIGRLARRLARARPFDVIHACNPPDLLLLPVLPQRLRGTRFIFDHHDLVPELLLARFGKRHRMLHRIALLMERLAFGLADVVLSTNETFRSIALDRGGKPVEDVFVVRNGPDPEHFRPRVAEDSLRAEPHILGYVGTMGPQDGVDHALHALAALAERRLDWRAVFAGEGDALADLQRLAQELGLASLVDFPGFLEQDDVIRLISSTDVCLAPEPLNPLNDASTLIKVAEYMSCARPVVCFDLTESRRTAGASALYARPNDVRSFAACIDELLDNPARASAMGAEGRSRVVRLLSWERSKRELLAAYARCVGQSDPTQAPLPSPHG